MPIPASDAELYFHCHWGKLSDEYMGSFYTIFATAYECVIVWKIES